MLSVFTWLADRIAYDLLALAPTGQWGQAVHFFVEDVSKIFVLLVGVVWLMGFFRSLLSPERVRALLGGRGRAAAYPLAVGLGAVTPFCSCSSVPLFIGFLEAGIPLGVTMAFLIASPMINEVAVVILASTLGLKVAVLYVGAGLAVGLAGGLLIDRLHLEGWVEDYVWQIRMGQLQPAAAGTALRARVRYAGEQVREIVGRIWPYVLAGIGIGALLHGFVPQSFLVAHAGADNPLAVPAAVLMGIPMYANATGVIPVAEALLGKGVAVGTVLALMMSVAAISLPEMIILRRVLKLPLILVFTGILLVAFVAVGTLFNWLL